MKKLLTTLILPIIILTGCDRCNNSTIGNTAGNTDSTTKDTAAADTGSAVQRMAALAPPTDLVYEALDGTPRDKALEMVKNFQSANRTIKYANESFLIDSNMLSAISKMLRAEKAVPVSANGYKTDGIRIYFGLETPTSKKIRLILVSTTDSIPHNSRQSKHHDYYGHSKAALHSVPLTITPETFTTPGAALRGAVLPGDYARNGNCIPVTIPGEILTSYAKHMVQNFKGQVVYTNAVWFNLERFERMLTEKDFRGLRIYMATYHDSAYGSMGKSTFVLTTIDSTKADYFYCDPQVSKYEIVNKKLKSYKGPTENNGELCPDNCDRP